MRLRKTTFVGIATVLAIATATVHTESRTPYSRIVAFGASLSDSGNAFALRGGSNTPPDYLLDPLLVPSAPYARGGHHFSNGATWIEQFARSTGLSASVGPALQSAGNGTNYAVGGARAHEDGVNFNLSAQVEAFLQDVGGAAPSDALYTIEMGGNDIRDALVVYPSGSGADSAGRDHLDGEQHRQAVCSRRTDLHRLACPERRTDAGDTHARPNQPRRDAAGDRADDGIQRWSRRRRGAAAEVLPGIRIVQLDAFRLLNDIVATPIAYGLTDVTSPCVTPNVPPFTCQEPDEFLFWDGIHPTKAVHAIIAQEAASALSR